MPKQGSSGVDPKGSDCRHLAQVFQFRIISNRKGGRGALVFPSMWVVCFGVFKCQKAELSEPRQQVGLGPVITRGGMKASQPLLAPTERSAQLPKELPLARIAIGGQGKQDLTGLPASVGREGEEALPGIRRGAGGTYEVVAFGQS